MDDIKNKAHLAIDSEIGDYKVGDHIFTADFGGDGTGKCSFEVKEYEIKKIQKVMGKNNYSEIFDIRFPKALIKTDLTTGYFKTEKEAKKAFLDSVEYIYTECKKIYTEEYGKDNA